MRVQVIFDTETYFHLVLASPPWVVPTHLTLFPYLEDDVPTRQRILGELNVRLWETPELKSRLMASPKEFLTGEGLEFADGLTVKILENSARKMFLPIPFQPSKLDPENGLEFARGLAASRIQGVLRSKLY